MPPLALILAFSMDLVLGDPRWLPHPVRLIGGLAGLVQKVFHAPGLRKSADLASGFAMAAGVTLLVFFVVRYLVGFVSQHIGPAAGMAAGVLLGYTTLSARGLADAARGVLGPLEKGDLVLARERLSMIVGRDTGGLEGPEIVRAAVETVAENASDGVVAPLFYLAIGGAPLAMAYKAVNTLDSMFGYKDERHLYFGRASARLDDLANFIPARLTGLMLVAAAWALSPGGRYSGGGSWRMFLRDRRMHPSPNSGCPEAAVAGALRVRLGGEASYFGRKGMKPFIGDPEEALTPGKIGDAVRLMYAASFIALLVFALAAFFARSV